MNYKNVSVCELQCLHQLAQVIGYDDAMMHLRLALDNYPSDRTFNVDCMTFKGAFIWAFTPQKFKFWHDLWLQAERINKIYGMMLYEDLRKKISDR